MFIAYLEPFYFVVGSKLLIVSVNAPKRDNVSGWSDYDVREVRWIFINGSGKSL